MPRTKIAENKTGCSNLFLKINDDYSKAIEGEVDRCSAFVADVTAAPDDNNPPLPPSPPPSPPRTGQTHYFSLILPSGIYMDLKPLDYGVIRDLYSAPIQYPASYPQYAWQMEVGEFLEFAWIPAPKASLKPYRLKFKTLSGNIITRFGTWQYMPLEVKEYPGVRCINYPFYPFSNPRPPIPPTPSPPVPPVPPPPVTTRQLEIDRIVGATTTTEVLEKSFNLTVNKAAFLCEDCENNCVLVIKQKTHNFQQGICFCKDNEEDLEEMKARIKAELLQELPPIVQTRMKAQDLPNLKTEVGQGLDQKIATAKSEIKSELETDEAFKSGLKDQIKNEILADPAFLQSLVEQVTQAIQEEDFKAQYFEFLNGDKIAEIITESLTEESKLNALKTKLGITPANNQNQPSDPNKLIANGYEWTIAKTGEEVSSVSRTAEANDNLSTLANSGVAIGTALRTKFPGKNFNVMSGTQSAGTYTYSIDQY